MACKEEAKVRANIVSDNGWIVGKCYVCKIVLYVGGVSHEIAIKDTDIKSVCSSCFHKLKDVQ